MLPFEPDTTWRARPSHGGRPACASRSSASRHETNTFSSVPDRLRPVRGVRTSCAARRSSPSTATRTSTIAGLPPGRRGARLRGRAADVRADRARSATITKDAYDRLTDEMFGMLRDQGPWDGVLIANHGAAVSEEHPDMDGAFAEAVRAIVGPGRAASGSASTCTATSSKRRGRGRPTSRRLAHQPAPRPQAAQPQDRGARVPRRPRARSGRASGSRRRRWSSTSSASSPARSRCAALVADCVAANERPGILDTSVAEGYPYADVEQMGMAWIAIADGDLDAARGCRRAGWPSAAWARRARRSTSRRPSIAEALDMAVARYRGPRAPGDVDPCATDGTPLAARGRRPRTPASGAAARADRADGRRRQHRRRLVGGLDAHPGRGAAARDHSLLQTLYDPESVEGLRPRPGSAPRSASASAARRTTCTARPSP